MPFAQTDDGVKLYYEETGRGYPVIFVHEFAGDFRSWEPQVRFFSRRNRCVTFNARGFPPSDVPGDVSMYSQDRACADIHDLMRHLKIAEAHIVGLSMGGFAALHFGLNHPDAARSLVVAGCGYGAEPDQREKFREETETTARRFETEGMDDFAKIYATGPTRVQFQNKDPRGWQEFADQLREHSAPGSALTMRGVQRERPSLWDLEDRLKTLSIPTLIIAGDEDEPCLLPGIYMKRTIRSAGLTVMAKTGHLVNLEEPELFNQAVAQFLDLVEAGRWDVRDPRSLTGSILGSDRTSA
ncbi:MAG: alpha/beta hydrolase [Alphaproteobacteria bacterium]|nr:alpha/beta hydrolase [Alphaproteobacteria bacterium]